MRGISAGFPAVDYLGLVLRNRIASVRAAAEGDGEERQFGASAVEWVVITMIVLVIIGVAAAFIIPSLDAKSTAINNCITNAGDNNSTCLP